MMKKAIYFAMSFAPVLALAQGANLSGISNLVTQFGGIIAKIIPVMFAIAVIYFFWGVIQFLSGAGDEKKHAAGKAHMIYGVIAIAVMVSLYGLIAWLQVNLGINAGGSVILPVVPGL